MNETSNFSKSFRAHAWAYLVDSGSRPDELDAAEAVLRSDVDVTLELLGEAAHDVVLSMPPDGHRRLAQLISPRAATRTWSALAMALCGAVAEARSHGGPGLVHLRRAHGLVLVLGALGHGGDLVLDDWLWLGEDDEHLEAELLRPLTAWCEAHRPPPQPMVDRLQRLDEDTAAFGNPLAALLKGEPVLIPTKPKRRSVRHLVAMATGARPPDASDEDTLVAARSLLVLTQHLDGRERGEVVGAAVRLLQRLPPVRWPMEDLQRAVALSREVAPELEVVAAEMGEVRSRAVEAWSRTRRSAEVHREHGGSR